MLPHFISGESIDDHFLCLQFRCLVTMKLQKYKFIITSHGQVNFNHLRQPNHTVETKP